MINNVKSIEDIASYLRSVGEVLTPLSANKIQELEAKIGHPLPEVYRRFLLLMGNGAGAYMRGSSVFYSEIFLLQEGIAELILENELTPLPDNAFAFWMHQGYQAAYFLLEGNPDPPVYFFAEGSLPKEFYIKEHSLTSFFLAQFLMSGYK